MQLEKLDVLGLKTNQILISNFVENQTVDHNNFRNKMQFMITNKPEDSEIRRLE